jgi:hypothetical protein
MAAGTASANLDALVRSLDGRENVTLGEILDGLGRAGLGLTILLLSLPVLIPIPGPIGVVFGSCLSLVGLQVMAGVRRIWLPDWLRERRLPSGAILAMTERTIPWIARAENLMQRRRLMVLTGKTAQALLGVPIFLLAVSVALPLPLGNFLPVLALCAIALAVLERDGLAVLIALVLSALSLAWTGLLLLTGAEVMEWLFGWLGLA